MLEDLQPNSFEKPCRLVEIAEELEEKDAKIFWQAIEDRASWGNVGLSRALSKRGLKISDKPIARHREGRCPCSKT